jgi:hypothetical protein
VVEQPVELGAAGGHPGDLVDVGAVHAGGGQGVELELGVLGSRAGAGV